MWYGMLPAEPPPHHPTRLCLEIRVAVEEAHRPLGPAGRAVLLAPRLRKWS